MKTAEIQRLIQNLCRVGTIDKLDHAAHKVRVKIGDNLTAWLQWPADVGRNYIHWRPLRIGTAVILLSPSGDISQGHIVGTLYSSENPTPSTDETTDTIVFDDGTALTYNSADHTFTIDCAGSVIIHCTDASVTASGTAVIDAGGGVNVVTDGDAVIEAAGNIAATGATITLNEGTGGGVVCQNHVCAFTGAPHPQGSITVTAGN